MRHITQSLKAIHGQNVCTDLASLRTHRKAQYIINITFVYNHTPRPTPRKLEAIGLFTESLASLFWKVKNIFLIRNKEVREG